MNTPSQRPQRMPGRDMLAECRRNAGLPERAQFGLAQTPEPRHWWDHLVPLFMLMLSVGSILCFLWLTQHLPLWLRVLLCP